jgi:hypothetical protein
VWRKKPPALPTAHGPTSPDHRAPRPPQHRPDAVITITAMPLHVAGAAPGDHSVQHLAGERIYGPAVPDIDHIPYDHRNGRTARAPPSRRATRFHRGWRFAVPRGAVGPDERHCEAERRKPKRDEFACLAVECARRIECRDPDQVAREVHQRIAPLGKRAAQLTSVFAGECHCAADHPPPRRTCPHRGRNGLLRPVVSVSTAQPRPS